MSVTEAQTGGDRGGRKRKADATEVEIEIDVDAPEPPSKKALRKAKRTKTTKAKDDQQTADKATTEPTQPGDAQEGAQEGPRRSQWGIWIGNLSFGITKDDLIKFLTDGSTGAITTDRVTRVHLPLGAPKFGKPCNKGFAYVDFADADALRVALTLTESLVDGRRLLIKSANDFQGRPERNSSTSADSPSHPPNVRIFVGNLDFDTTVDDLEQHFGRFGALAHTHMATFQDSGKCKGYAWVEFQDLASAEAAMSGRVPAGDVADSESGRRRSSQSKGVPHKIHGRKLRMDYAEDKTTRYQKRFGKGAKPAVSNTAVDAPAPVDNAHSTQEVPGDARPRLPRMQKTSKRNDKYAPETVQRLTGAIVEGQGQRTVFE